ncbi:cytochrome o ubiquinol oxidase subunit IV [Pseudomonas sp. NPDC089554]|uniref:cytochrome o ubiquinol oxidase subunit IV n=1 Tax=Pseudomonas sp. NPDC089554 TaxID=3390653 RepID=UPI003D076611
MANAHDTTHHEGNHGSVKSYMIGFVLSIILTAIPFGLVMFPTLPKNLTVLIVVAMAVIQVVVHLVYFLHMDRSKEQRSNVSTFLFTVLVIALLVGLSLWIMFSIHIEMMAK